MAEQRMLEKLNRSLTDDIAPMLPTGIRFNDEDALHAFEIVWTQVITRIKGEPWKMTDQAIKDLRAVKHPTLLVNVG